MCGVLTLTIACATAIAVSSTSAQPVLSRYRGVTLGDPVQVVVDQLWREPSTNRIKLTVTSIATDRAMQEATADGLRLEASEAPARDLARRATEDAALRARDEKARSDNKATFKP
jgi:hypothetical protein